MQFSTPVKQYILLTNKFSFRKKNITMNCKFPQVDKSPEKKKIQWVILVFCCAAQVALILCSRRLSGKYRQLLASHGSQQLASHGSQQLASHGSQQLASHGSSHQKPK